MPHSRKTLAVLVLLSVLVAVVGTVPVWANTQDADNKTTVQLTEDQKKELAALHKDILAKKKELISKYVEYGVISKEKGEKIISRLEKRYERLEQNGFVPHWDKCKKKGSH